MADRSQARDVLIARCCSFDSDPLPKLKKKEMEVGKKKNAPPPLYKAVCMFDSLLLANFTEQSTLGCFCINSLTGQVTLHNGLWSISLGVRCSAVSRASKEIFPHSAAICSLSLTFPVANLLYQRWKISIAGGSGEQEEKSESHSGFKVTLHLDGC